MRTRLLEPYRKTSPLIGCCYAKADLKPVSGFGEAQEVATQIAGLLGG